MALPAANVRDAASSWPKNPYPGLRPFETDEWQIFFGRESMVDDVVVRMAQQRLVFVHGASGSGKSSLVRAGVLPKLAFQHLRHGADWLTLTMRPSGGPLWNLAHEFAKLEGRAEDIRRIGQIIRLFNQRGATLSSVGAALKGVAGKRLCILVDQFEELFRFERETSREEAELFVSLITGVMAAEPDLHDGQSQPAVHQIKPDRTGADIHLIITMRSEFLGECARYDGLAEAFNRTQYLVPRMKREALIRAIRRPAELYGGHVTAELADRLVADVRGREDELPLIQHGLMLMWHTVKPDHPNEQVTLGEDLLTTTGGLVALLSDHADGVMDEVVSPRNVSPAESDPERHPIIRETKDAIAGFAYRVKAQALHLEKGSSPPRNQSALIVERLFRALTDINADGRAIRRPQYFRDLVTLCGTSEEELRRVIDAFRAEGASFLSPYPPEPINDDTEIDIGHEALIRCWDKIADPQHGWLHREFEDGLVWRSLSIQSKAFQTDRRQMLSPATARQRATWLANRPPLWSERYGGGWAPIADLIQTSNRRGMRGDRIRRIFKLYGLCIVVVLLFAAGESYWKERGVFTDIIEVLGTVGMSIVSLWVFLLMCQIAFDYYRQLSDWIRRTKLSP
jgi:hypothetical protein